MKRRTKKDRTTKDGRTILSPKSYTALRMLAFDLSGGICECGCGRPAPWPDSGRPPMPWEGALHHLNGRGMGSGKRNDVLSEVAWWREECHHKHHSPKVVPAKGKSMKRDRHLLISNVPLKEGQDYTALCGKKITKAAWVWTDGDVNTLTEWMDKFYWVCRKCKAEYYKRPSEPLTRVNVYGATDGELAIKVESE